jgi:hypothetical protein
VSVDLLLFALADALLEHMVTLSWEMRHSSLVEAESADWIARLGAWRMTWWR